MRRRCLLGGWRLCLAVEVYHCAAQPAEYIGSACLREALETGQERAELARK
jgi:hypothetical protein